MDKKILLFIGVGIIIIGLGVRGYFFLIPKCPESCDDSNPCTQDVCSKETNYECSHSAIPDCCGNKICEVEENYESCPADCPDCDDNNDCTKDSYDYHEQKCKNSPILNIICCGNTVCETGEKYENCARDCPNCDDANKCTKDNYDYHKQKCINDIIIPCCGNGICDKGIETRSNCSVDCPSCDDNNRLTVDSFNYITQKCENIITHYFIDDFESGIQNWSSGASPEDPTATWSTKLEGGNTVFRGIGHNWTDLVGKEWADYIFKSRFKIIQGSIHFNYRVKHGTGGGSRYFIGVGSNHLMLSKQINENFYSGLAEEAMNLGQGWHTIEIRGYGNTLNIYIDNVLLIKYKDTQSPVLSGGVALETHQNSEFWIDDVEIKVINAKDVTYP